MTFTPRSSNHMHLIQLVERFVRDRHWLPALHANISGPARFEVRCSPDLIRCDMPLIKWISGFDDITVVEAPPAHPDVDFEMRVVFNNETLNERYLKAIGSNVIVQILANSHRSARGSIGGC